MRMIRILMATVVMGVCQNADALTVLVDSAWVRAGFGSAGDRCLDGVLLDLKPGDTFNLILPALDEGATPGPLIGFTAYRRPSVRAAELIATRQRLNQVLATADPTDWPSLAEILAQVAAASDPDKRRELRYVIVGALIATDPPTLDLALQRLLRGRRITIVDLAHLDPELRESRIKAWRDFFTTAGVVQLAILPVAVLDPSEPRASRPRTQPIDCSGHRFQVLDD